jgi:prophage regulatory protein
MSSEKIKKTLEVKPLYLELEAVAATIGLAAATIQRLVRTGSFPKPRQLSDRRVAWLVRELEDWAENRPVSDLLPPSNTSRLKTEALGNAHPDERAIVS